MRSLAFVALVFGLMLLACCYRQVISEPEQRAVDAAVRGWTEAIGKPDARECGLDLVTVVHALTSEDFEAYCEAPATHYACLRYRSVGMNRSAPRIILRPGLDHAQAAEGVIHETLHALVDCELDRGVRDPFDARHADPRVWARQGREKSAQWSAREALKRTSL